MECPHAIGVIDEKQVAMKKPSRSGIGFYNCKDFFSPFLLALVDAEYRFLWVDILTSGSSSVAQIFNCWKLKKNIENGTLGLPVSEPLGEGLHLH